MADDTAEEPMLCLAVAGGAEVSAANVEELLSDLVRLNTDDEREFAFFLPADRHLTSDAVVLTAEWLCDMNEGYLAVESDKLGRRGRNVSDNAEEALKPEGDATVAEYLIDLLADAQEQGDECYLILAWGPDAEAPDEETEELFALAEDAGITVLDLTKGLDELTSDDESDDSGEEADDSEEEHSDAREDRHEEKELVEEEKELAEPADEAQAIESIGSLEKIDNDAAEAVDGGMPDLVTTLAFVAQRLDFEDRANAAKNMQPVKRSPLSEAVRYHLSELMGQQQHAKAPESAKKPHAPKQEDKPARPRRGKPRDIDSDVVGVYVNDEDKTIRLIQGRGRPKKGEEKRALTRSQYEEMVSGGDYKVV